MSLLFVDCAWYQGDLDTDALKKAGIVAVISKATEIMRYRGPVDEYYFSNKARCLSAGFLHGAYLYLDPTDGRQQADFFLDTVKPDGKTLLAIDVEEAGITLKQVEDAILRIHERTGVYPVLYTGYYVLQRIGGLSSDVLSMCYLWIAGKPPRIPPEWDYYTFWQFDYLKLGNKTFDLNIFQGSYSDLQEVWTMTSPVLTDGLEQVTLVDTNDIPAFTTPGGALHHWIKAGDSVVVNRTVTQVDRGVTYMESPLDYWLNIAHVPSVGVPVPPPVKTKYTAKEALNIRKDASIKPNGTPQGAPAGVVLMQAKAGAVIETVGDADTTYYKWIHVVSVDGVAIDAVASSTYLRPI